MTGSFVGNGFNLTRDPIAADLTVTIVVTDAEGFDSSAVIGVRGVNGDESDAAVLLAGPLRGSVGEELIFRIMFWGSVEGVFTLPPQVVVGGIAGTASVDGDDVRVSFTEPGIGVLELVDSAPGYELWEQARMGSAAVNVIGSVEAPQPTTIAAATTSSVAATVDNLPWTFAGGGTSVRFLEGGTGSCGGDLTATVTLHEDGSVTGAMDFENPGISFDGFHMECFDSVMQTVELFGSHGGGSIEILLGGPDRPKGLEGPITAESIEAEARFSAPGEGEFAGKSHVTEWSLALIRTEG